VKKILITIPLIIAISGCSEESEIKDVIRANLKDPKSAQFKDYIESSDDITACITWNAKNGMGGYGEWEMAELKKSENGWEIVSLNTNPNLCSKEAFSARKKISSAQEDAKYEAIQTLKKSLNISQSEVEKLAKSDECKLTISIYSQYAEEIIKNIANGTRDSYAEQQHIELQRKFESGNCSRFSA
jgi:hypothetical protein